MAKYKVKVIGIMKANGKVAKFGEILDETEMVDAAASLKGGFVDFVAGSDKVEAKAPTKGASTQGIGLTQADIDTAVAKATADKQAEIDAAVQKALEAKQAEIDAAVQKALEAKQAEIDAANTQTDKTPAPDVENDLIKAAKTGK